MEGNAWGEKLEMNEIAKYAKIAEVERFAICIFLFK